VRVFLRYALRETGSNLWRNRFMTLAAILTVAVSLSLVGAALFMKQSAAQATVVWQRETQVAVWMNVNASKPEIASVKSQLATTPYVAAPCQYKDKQQSYEEAKRLLTPTEFAYLKPKLMPPFFVCVPKVPTDYSILSSTFTGEPGVMVVTGPAKQIKEMESAIRVLQIIFLTLALVLLVSAAVLILNTIRLAIFSRRREVTVMKLVGATNWFIRLPYITEGFMQGLLGSLVAALAITAFGSWYPLAHEYQLSTQDLIGTDVVVILLGAVIGSIGSAFAIRRFLDV
jgi:cell division transport system permease protein